MYGIANISESIAEKGVKKMKLYLKFFYKCFVLFGGLFKTL